MGIVYLNGDYLPIEEAHVSVLDRGFVFADGVYELIPAYGGNLFRLAQHLQRLDNSLRGIRLDNPLDHNQWTAILQKIVKHNNKAGTDLSVYLQVTRGAASRDHAFPANSQPTVFVMANPMQPVPTEHLQNGVKAISHEDIRWRYCHIKSIALLPNILMKQLAHEAGAVEAILYRDDLVTEGAASNVFIVQAGKILTPRQHETLLPGITRDLILELAATDNVDCNEAEISVAMLRNADEIWVTNSTKEILPVTQLDDKQVGDGKPGPHWRAMLDRYQAYKDKLRSGTAD